MKPPLRSITVTLDPVKAFCKLDAVIVKVSLFIIALVPAVYVLTIILVITLLNIVTSTVKNPSKSVVDGVAVILVSVISVVTPVISVGYVIVPANVSCVLPTGTDLPGIPFLSIVMISLAAYPAPGSVTIILATLLFSTTNLLVNLVVSVPPDTLAASILTDVELVAVLTCCVIFANVSSITISSP